jgi:hypothetical protein
MIGRKYHVKNIALPGSLLEKDGNGDESEHSDYC